ncbi:MAG: metallophosphoesterase, partial [Myxococcota bacterium]|nr:metallophosphoesterase [Myxococcota bacterium]
EGPSLWTFRWAWAAAALLLFAAFYVGAHFYLALRLILEPQWPAWVTSGLLIGLCLLGGLTLLQPLAERFLPIWVDRIVAWPAALWMGFGFFFLLSLAASDVLLMFLQFLGISTGDSLAENRALAVVVFVVPIALWSLSRGLQKPKVKRVEISIDRWPAALEGLRIVQISDIHFGPILDERFAQWLMEQVNALKPDLIAVTGDLVDGRIDKIAHTVEPLVGLQAPLGRWFVTGNHDHYSSASDWAGRAEGLGMRVLRNAHAVIETKGERFVLAGVDDHRSRQMPGEGGEDLDLALLGVPENCPVVLLAHDPTTFHTASRRSVDLQLSGHTHGGQIWPFHYGVRLAMPWVAGLHRRGRSQIYVSRGTGFWGPPMRLGAPAEITEILLRSGRTADGLERGVDGLRNSC